MTRTEIDAQLSEIQAIRLSNYPRVVELAQLVLAQSREIAYIPGIVASLNYIAWGYNRLDQYSKALYPAKEALLLSREHGLREAEGYALCNMVVCLYVSHEYEEEIRSLHLQIVIGEEVDNPELIAAAYHDLGSTYAIRNDLDVSNRYFERCIQLAVVNDLHYILCFAYVGLANNLRGSDIEREFALVNKALDAARSSDFALGMTMALSCLTNLSLRNNDIEQAVAFATQIDPASVDYPIQQAAIARKRGRSAEAIRLLETMLEQFEVFDVAQQYQTLAEIYAEVGNFESAYRCIQRVNTETALWYERQITSRIEVITAVHDLELLKRELAEQQRTENERVARQRAELELAQQQQIMNIKRELLIRMSHEFRTPLAIMRTSFDILNRYADRLTPERKAEHVEKIDAQYVVLEHMLDDILDVLRANNVTLPFEDQPLYNEP